ncbi:nitrile hydratase accessory protein [Pseudotabrizicola sp. 4114]|uniref:nitrile hydratase accessory protein n=1 Tax=Pseudotabrizicola sp. 4114 TaxID=2817731 RepID=UPI00285AD90A|nr:nitrile hydratase accessory protein [Pseudorhodobacter sp. 4114]
MQNTYKQIEGLPLEGEDPVFSAPWEAKAFAITVKLSELGHFTWAEWVETFAAEVRHAESHKDFDAGHDDGSAYYHTWLIALEKLLEAKSLVSDAELDSRHQHLIDNPVPHDHVARREPVCVA